MRERLERIERDVARAVATVAGPLRVLGLGGLLPDLIGLLRDIITEIEELKRRA